MEKRKSIKFCLYRSIYKCSLCCSEEKAKKEERARKKAMLQAVEEAQSRMSQTQDKGQKQTWAESLITAIIKNLEVNLTISGDLCSSVAMVTSPSD